jgi:hypothetical protein
MEKEATEDRGTKKPFSSNETESLAGRSIPKGQWKTDALGPSAISFSVRTLINAHGAF